MSEFIATGPKGGRGTSAWITAVLAVSAAATVGYWSVKALGRDDTEAMESPLMLSVARQLVAGPWELYGPFGGPNPLVLIHAPLYYRAAGLLAWPMARAGLHPVEASRVAGRLLSAAGLAATLLAAYRLGRLGGLPRRAGWWSVLLVAAAPVLAGQPFAVRPDMAGVALQTWGAVLVLESLSAGRARRVGAGSLLFGLAACVKQHFLGAWAVSVALLTLGWLRGRVGLGPAVRAVLPGVIVAGLVYSVEWLVTGGRIWDAAFVAAANVGRVHPGGWDHVWIVFLGIANQVAGLVTLLVAPALIAAGSRRGVVGRLLIGAGTVAIGLALTAQVIQSLLLRSWPGVATIAAAALATVAALPAVLLSRRASSMPNGIDAALWAYLVVEVSLVTILSGLSTGAWLNYAIPAIVFASALAARGLAGALDADPPWRLGLPAILAALAILASSVHGVKEAARRERVEDAIVERIYSHLERPRSSYFFTDRPGWNRVNGRLELVYDDWLYPVFESLGLAESRSRWLGSPLAKGPVRVVVNTNDRSFVDGTNLDLRRLGYRPDVSLGPFFVWTR